MNGNDTNTAVLVYLRTRYTVTGGDLSSLVTRYLAENPLNIAEMTARMATLIRLAQAA